MYDKIVNDEQMLLMTMMTMMMKIMMMNDNNDHCDYDNSHDQDILIT